MRTCLTLSLLLIPSIGFSQEDEHVPARPYTPSEQYSFMVTNLESIDDPAIRLQRRYLYCPGNTEEQIANERAAIAFIVNSVIARTEVDVKYTDDPTKLGLSTVDVLGRIVAIDLAICCPKSTDLASVLNLWSALSDSTTFGPEPYYHGRTFWKKAVAPYKASNGVTYSFINTYRALYAEHLGELGPKAELLIGNVSPDKVSFCPLLHAGWFSWKVLSTADDGRYYDFRGINKKVKLDDYLESRGASRKRVKAVRSDERAAMQSEVTDKARGISIFPSEGTRLSAGPGIIAITDDPFDDTVKTEFDPYRELLAGKTNGHEVFVTLPSGWIEFSLWDANGNLVNEAPPNLVADHKIPAPHTKRLQGAISCIRCHGTNSMWQPFDNEVAAMLGDTIKVYGDTKGGSDQHDVLRRLAGLYSGDLSKVITNAQDAFAERTQAVCDLDPVKACDAVAGLYNRYEYTPVDAKVALWDLGSLPEKDDGLGVMSFRKLVPAIHPQGLLVDDPIIGRLHVTYFSTKKQKRSSLTNTRRQWEQVFSLAAIRSKKGRNP